MADPNPSIPDDDQTKVFEFLLILLQIILKRLLIMGRNIFISRHNRYRGVCHFYLEKYKSNNFEEDLRFAEKIGSNVNFNIFKFLKFKKKY